MELADAWSMANRLLDEHGPAGWSVAFDNAKRRAGVCRFERRVIGLSAPMTRLHSPAEVRETVLHEIAHALVGPRHGHDAVWVARARAIGSSAERCLPADVPRVAAAWLGVCRSGHVVERHRRPERVLFCARCPVSSTEPPPLDWTHHGRPAAMHPNYVAELRAIVDGEPMRVLAVGMRARVIAPGKFHGRVGRVLKRGRTSYHIELPEGTLRVLFAGAEPA
jgi:predicted SprT family Zn-dependent metalloprotease